MNIADIKKNAFAMPLTSPAFPPGSASLELHPHALAPVADLPVRKVVSAVHFIADMTLALGTVEFDYLT